MKISVSLLLLSIGLAFGAGYIALQVRQSEGHQFNFSISEISSLKRKFREKKPAAEELNTAALFSAQAGFELLDPRFVFSPARGQRFAVTASVFRADKLCKPNLITDSSLNKMKLWLSFRCGQLSQLPAYFFDRPPFMSPFGISFASLARNTDLEEFVSSGWLEKNIRYFHTLELSSLPATLNLEPKRKKLSQLDADTLLKMASGQSWISTETHILVRRTIESNGDFQRALPTADYLIYDRTDWNHFLAGYGVEIQDGSGVACSYHDDGLCWVRSSTSKAKIQWTMGFLFLLALGLVTFCVLQIIRNIRNQRREEERKRFALQALTHELRTPLASLVISSEQLFDQFDSLPASLKEPFLRMADDVQRLTRVAESSHNYLKASDSSSLVSFNSVEVPSINDFVSSALDRYSDEITFNKLDQDCSFNLDRYWVGTCLQNLVQNALQHGAKPIAVNLKRENASLTISVSDAGEMTELELKNLSKPFIKRARSSGLGLGLTIVETVMLAMNSKLKISMKPTCFELQIGEVK